ncbi:MAG: hypothetical protein CSA72_12630 [Rhodobacterales bacterium]|nr:MAG: hypothetical protein CSA72_12630 [Rhodobacterales bacterium]
MTWRRGIPALALALAGLLSACAAPPPPPAPVPSAPETSERPVPRPEQPTPSPAEPSSALLSKYARIENALLARGLLRTDGGGVDTPFTADMLARNFIDIAMYDEYSRAGGRIRARAVESNLRRWDQPVRMAISFGESVPEDRRVKDRNAVGAFAARLSRTPGVSITMTDQGSANYHVLFMSEADRRAAGPLLRTLVPGLDATVERALIDLDPDTLCAVVAFSTQADGGYTQAVAIIRDEHRGLLRQSCIHEELTQGLGLANDSPRARPSIFNDDEEFALLTTHDSLLLKMLYDRRLRTGMSRAEVEPIARTIANELVGGES